MYLETAASACAFLGLPAVAERWDDPSALARLRTGPLAAHLASQLVQVPPVLDAPVTGDRVSLSEHFARSTWTDGDLDSEVNTYIRRISEDAATAGHAAVTDAAGAALAQLRHRLPAEEPDRAVQLPFGPWSLTLADYLTTRLLELTVHVDDLAASVGAEPPAMPPAALDTTIGVLCRLAVERHGAPAVLRALSRAERAPRTIAAL
ncbi:Mycothiol maleylpyruvate isomerase N-terminal domain-containing protein [Paractinoplanes atraurantiacus]|uniref:Mycothiol maleylpyruvate isomerase N-terminal domain-containing protein n=1 Tax=Paractinoplanes atraurantiacus TaxID=1036182 RepID=A0A285IYV5_9ACTN|nr:Mycothiol maleylpyruvate isomerase N-terminal domain-containing protein [Actinoplanes atraurantiacus]